MKYLIFIFILFQCSVAIFAQNGHKLPFECGMEVPCTQGNSTSYSHVANTIGEYAYDFGISEGTKLYATKSGIVHLIKENSNLNCDNNSCASDGNYLVLDHQDGTFSLYLHLKYNGVEVDLGDAVNQGDFIAYSGNTGWSTGPHLHFQLMNSASNYWQQSIPFSFDDVGSPNTNENVTSGNCSEDANNPNFTNDLIITDHCLEKTLVEPGTNIQTACLVENLEQLVVSPFYVSYYLVKDVEDGFQRRFLDTKYVGGLDCYEKKVVWETISIPTNINYDNYRIEFVVDGYNSIVNERRINNTYASSVLGVTNASGSSTNCLVSPFGIISNSTNPCGTGTGGGGTSSTLIFDTSYIAAYHSENIDIEWTETGVSQVNLYYTDVATNVKTFIATSPVNWNNYTWSVPEILLGKDIYITIEDYNNNQVFDESNSFLIIEDDLELITPTGSTIYVSESVQVGDILPIEFSGNTINGMVQISIGSVILATLPISNGVFNWIVSSDYEGTNIHIRVSDPIDSSANEVSGAIYVGPDGCSINENINTNINAYQSDYAEASSSINASNSIYNNGEAEYRAGNEVVLSTGFEAFSGSDVHAYIASCSIPKSNGELPETEMADQIQDFMIYPNPANEQLFVSFTANEEGPVLIELYDLQGKLVKKVNQTISIGSNNLELDIQDINNGVYIIQLNDGQRTQSSKLVIQ